MLNRKELAIKDNSQSLHDTNLLSPAEIKYNVSEGRVPRSVVIKEKQHLMLPTCSNSYIFQLTKTWDKV